MVSMTIRLDPDALRDDLAAAGSPSRVLRPRRLTGGLVRNVLGAVNQDTGDLYNLRSYQRWANGEPMPRGVALGLFAIFRTLEIPENNARKALPELEPTEEESHRISRLVQMLLRGRSTQSQEGRLVRERSLNQRDLEFLVTGTIPVDSIPMCAATGTPYASSADASALGLFRLFGRTGRTVAFTYMSPHEPGQMKQAFNSEDIKTEIRGFYSLPMDPAGEDRGWGLIQNRWRQALARAEEEGFQFYDRGGLSLVATSPTIGTEGTGDDLDGLRLLCRWGSYFQGRVTNSILDQPLPGEVNAPDRPSLHFLPESFLPENPSSEREIRSVNEATTGQVGRTLDGLLPKESFLENPEGNLTYRDIWTKPMRSFDDPLVNLLQVNAFVITTGDPGTPRLHIGIRGAGVATNPASGGRLGWTPTVSGAASQDECLAADGAGITWSPRLTLLREGAEEVWGRGSQLLESSRYQVRFLGLSRTLAAYEPFLFGHVEIDCTANELEHHFTTNKTDKPDIRELYSLPLDPRAISQFVGECSPVVNRNVEPTVSVVIFMLYHELKYRFPELFPDFTNEFVDALLGAG